MISYLNILTDLIVNGEPHLDRTGTGTLSLFGYYWRHNLNKGFPLLTTKKMVLRLVFEELRWFLSGSTNAKDLQEMGVTIWDEWATAEQCAKFGREEGDLGPVYGQLWRNYEGLPDTDQWPNGNDQIASLIDNINKNPASRRLIVSGWHPIKQGQVALPPCHTLWQVKHHAKDDALSLCLYARSIDSFLGLPFNIASYALLLMLLAHVTNKNYRDLVIMFGDLHLYNNHIDQAHEQRLREPYPLPKVFIDESLRGGGLEALLACRWDHITLVDYKSHPKIAAPVSI